MSREWELIRDGRVSDRHHALTGWDPGPIDDAGRGDAPRTWRPTSATKPTGEAMDTRLEITSYNKIVFEGQFASVAQAEGFYAWWAGEPRLPQGGVTFMRVGAVDRWREAHPLPRQHLTPAQLRLIDLRLSGQADCEPEYVRPKTEVA